MTLLTEPKEQVPASFCQSFPTRNIAGMLMTLCLTGASHGTYADTVYRCGDAYSSFAQCAHGPAVEVKPYLDWANSDASKPRMASQTLREAQALEKQRLHIEHQAAQTAPVRLMPPSNIESEPMSYAAPTARRGQAKPHHRSSPSPYFTAKDPNTAGQKKGTAKAVPAPQAASHP